MKKVIYSVVLLLCLVGCCSQNDPSNTDNNSKYTEGQTLYISKNCMVVIYVDNFSGLADVYNPERDNYFKINFDDLSETCDNSSGRK
jgi:hypothetical protein